MQDDEPKKGPHRFPKGIGGNPKGRPRKGSALADAIKSTVDPFALARRIYEIAMSRKDGDPEGEDLFVDKQVSLQAANWLASNGFVKPAQQIEVHTTIRQIDEPLSAAERAEVKRLLEEEERREREMIQDAEIVSDDRLLVEKN